MATKYVLITVAPGHGEWSGPLLHKPGCYHANRKLALTTERREVTPSEALEGDWGWCRVCSPQGWEPEA